MERSLSEAGAAVARLESVFRTYARDLPTSFRVLDAEHGLPGLGTVVVVTAPLAPEPERVQGFDWLIDPRLLSAPPEALDYIAAHEGIKCGANPYPYPARTGMRVIRELLSRTGDHPFPRGPRPAYAQCAWDKQTRMLSPYRLTDDLAAWLDQHDTARTVYPSWRGRLVIQCHDADIWAGRTRRS